MKRFLATNLSRFVLFGVVLSMGTGFGIAWAEDARQVWVTAWRADTQGAISASTDGQSWSRLPAPTRLPSQAVYQGDKGLWRITLDDGRAVYVEARAFRSVEGEKVSCVRHANSSTQEITVRGFGGCP